MALFGSVRDSNLFKSINKELLHRIIDTEVLYYELNTETSIENLYSESDKSYYIPNLVHCLVTVDDQTWNDTDFGPDVAQTATFAFLKDDLVEKSIKPEIGDIIEYRSRFFELDGLVENQLVAGKDPENWFGGDTHGASISVIYAAHMTRISALNIIPIRYGTNQPITKRTSLPANI